MCSSTSGEITARRAMAPLKSEGASGPGFTPVVSRNSVYLWRVSHKSGQQISPTKAVPAERCAGTPTKPHAPPTLLGMVAGPEV